MAAQVEDTALGNPLEQLSLDQLRTRTSMKWTTHGADVLPLWVAEMDVQLAPTVASVLIRAIEAGDTGYPSGPAYAEAVASFAADRWGWDGVAVERTAVVPDVMLGIVEALKLISDPGDAVVVCAPVYPPFYAFVTHADRRIVEARLGPDWRLDLAALDDAFAEATRFSRRPVLLLANPHNPTGVVHTRAELTAVAALARRYGVRVISDEIHAPVVLAGASFVPFLSVPGAEDGFALYSASKGWNLAGLKAALLVAGPDTAPDLARLPEEVGHGPSHVGVLAHTAAFNRGRDWLDRLLSGLDANRTLLAEQVSRSMPDLPLVWPEATYLGWLDCRSLGLHHDSPPAEQGVVSDLSGPARMFLESARVALSSGHVFGTGGAGFVRINFATTPTILAEALHRMATSVDALRSPTNHHPRPHQARPLNRSNTMTTTTQPYADLDAINATMQAVTADRRLGEVRFNMHSESGGGAIAHTHTGALVQAGQADETRRGQFTVSSDEPIALLGTNTAISPAEYVLHALAGCYMVTLTSLAAARHIELRNIKLTLNFDIDLAGFLGIDHTVRKGAQSITVDVTIDSPANHDELEGLVQALEATSPIRDTIANPVPVTTRLS